MNKCIRLCRIFITLPAIALFILSCSPNTPTTRSLAVYCGAGLNKAATEIGTLFEKEHGVSILYNFAGSYTLLSQLEIVNKGDVFIPGEDYYMEIASAKKLVENPVPIAFHIPVIGVPKGNPKHITSIEDLAKPGIRLGLGDPKAAAIGKTAVDILKKNGLEQQVRKNVVTLTATVNELTVYVALNQVDAVITWEDNALTAAAKMDIVPIPEDRNMIKTIPAAVLAYSAQKQPAQQFIDFLLSPQAKEIFKKHGFTPYKQ
jgi:molybdate transport system substrate-binding protein